MHQLNPAPKMRKRVEKLILDGESLTIEDLMATSLETRVDLSEASWAAVRASRKVVENFISKNDASIYGVNTGVGNFANVRISPDELSSLQVNLIRSHAAGTGPILSPERAKRLLLLRINVLAKGFSGISVETLQRIIGFCNVGCVSKVPEQGTLGASGDMAPLAHLALGMMGEGEMWDPELGSWFPAKSVSAKYKLQLLELQPKEGVALINGSQLIASLGAEAVWRCENLSLCADAVASVSLEALAGSVQAYFPEVHAPRPHAGQQLSARNMRALLDSEIYPSEISQSHRNCCNVQDAYSIRCGPQVHGIVYDTVKFAKRIIETEMNSATDNPMVFSETGRIISGGNFHGEYPAKVLDYLAIAVQELGSISERRLERLVNGSLSGLPPFLVPQGGLNSGFMLAHCTSASLVSENKTLAHPASVDSIPTSAAKEDHVSMGGWAARKCLRVVSNVENVLAIELLAAVQGIELRHPLKSTEPIEKVFELVRDQAGVQAWHQDRFFHPDIALANEVIVSGKLVATLKPYWDKWSTLDPNKNYKNNGNYCK